MGCELEAKIAEDMHDFVQGLDLMRREFETLLIEVEAQAVQELMSAEYRHQNSMG
jgi:hypothetical protein